MSERGRPFRDQGSPLAQAGLLDAQRFPVVGPETARRLLEPSRGGRDAAAPKG